MFLAMTKKEANVLCVLASVYGMPQSSARLTSQFNAQAAKADCRPTKSDPNFYVMRKDGHQLMFPRHEDDIGKERRRN